jgi:uncharacterized protein (DUF1330 family)
MTAFVIAQIKIEDPEGYKEYLQGFMPIFESYGGRILAAARDTDVVEGMWAYPRTMVMQFPSLKDARDWLDDPEYRALAAIRHRTAQTNMVVVEGAA